MDKHNGTLVIEMIFTHERTFESGIMVDATSYDPQETGRFAWEWQDSNGKSQQSQWFRIDTAPTWLKDKYETPVVL